MALGRRSVIAIVLFALALLVAVLAAIAVADPFHLRYARFFTAGLVFLAILLVTLALVVVTRKWLRGLVAVVGVVALVGWAVLVGFASGLQRASADMSTVASGQQRLVVMQGATAAKGPVFAVVVRAGGGPFEQESLVYQGLEGGQPPTAVRFVDPGSVEVQVGRCDYRSAVDPGTLDVDSIHEPLLPGGC